MLPLVRFIPPALGLWGLLALPASGDEAPPRPVRKLEMRAVWSPHCDPRPDPCRIDAIVIHDTETPGVTRAATIVNHFLNPRSEVSAHYVIGKAGEIVQCVPDELRAWHAGPSHMDGRTHVNDFSIGIELVNAQTGRDPFTDAQYESLVALTAALIEAHDIPLERIVGHKDVTDYPAVKRDPASNFDWARYKRGVSRLLPSVRVSRYVKLSQ